MKQNQKYFNNKNFIYNTEEFVEILPVIENKKDFRLNNGQLKSKQIIEEWLKDPRDKYLGLIGRAGTGKTTTLSTIDFPENIVGVAPTHKAKDILCKSLQIPCITIATLIFAKIKYIESQEVFISDKSKWKSALPYYLIIIDESSMIDSQTFQTIQQIYPLSKILFIGDSGQLASILEPKYSVFDDIRTVELTENMRSGEDSSILELANLNYKTEDVFLTENSKDVQIVDKNAYIELFKEGKIDTICCYTNKAKDFINKRLHEVMFPNTKYAVGEMMISNENVGAVEEILDLGSGKTKRKITYNIYNSEMIRTRKVSDLLKLLMDVTQEIPVFYKDSYGIVKKVNGKAVIKEWQNTDIILFSEKFDCYILEFEKRNIFTDEWKKVDFKPKIRENVVEQDTVKWKDFLDRVFKLALSLKISWESYHKYKNTFSDITYAYAISTYKAQGSTFNNIAVVYNDIMTCRNKKTRRELFYTAVTRAKHKVYILK